MSCHQGEKKVVTRCSQSSPPKLGTLYIALEFVWQPFRQQAFSEGEVISLVLCCVLVSIFGINMDMELYMKRRVSRPPCQPYNVAPINDGGWFWWRSWKPSQVSIIQNCCSSNNEESWVYLFSTTTQQILKKNSGAGLLLFEEANFEWLKSSSFSHRKSIAFAVYTRILVHRLAVAVYTY